MLALKFPEAPTVKASCGFFVSPMLTPEHLPPLHPVLLCPGLQRVEVWCAGFVSGVRGEGAGTDSPLHPLQTELLPRCGEVEPVGKVVQEDGRMLLIAVLEVSWSRWGLDGGAVTSLLKQLHLLGVLSLWFLSSLILFLPHLNGWKLSWLL